MNLQEAKKMAQGICRYDRKESVVLCFNEDKGYYILPFIYVCDPNDAMYYCDINGKLSSVGNLDISLEV